MRNFFIVRATLRDVAVWSVADVNEVDGAEIGRAVVIAGFVGRKFIRLGSRRTRLTRGVSVGTDDIRHLIDVVQAVDRTYTCRIEPPWSVDVGVASVDHIIMYVSRLHPCVGLCPVVNFSKKTLSVTLLSLTSHHDCQQTKWKHSRLAS